MRMDEAMAALEGGNTMTTTEMITALGGTPEDSTNNIGKVGTGPEDLRAVSLG